MKRILQGKMCWKTYCFYFIRQEEKIKSNEHIFHSSKIFKYFSQNPSTFQGLEGGISFSSFFKHFFSFSRIRTHPVHCKNLEIMVQNIKGDLVPHAFILVPLYSGIFSGFKHSCFTLSQPKITLSHIDQWCLFCLFRSKSIHLTH